MNRTSVAEKWVDGTAGMTRPSNVVWCDGSKAEYERLIEEMLGDGTLLPVNTHTYPGCYLHRSHPSDVARTEQLTFICTRDKDDAGPTNNWMAPAEAKAKAGEYFKGAMRGRTMYVIPYLMGPAGSTMSRTGIMVTDSAYVVASMHIMARVGDVAIKAMRRDDDFIAGVHSLGDLSPDRRLILQFPEEKLIWSVGSGYGGNALLGKKCHALRLGSWQARVDGGRRHRVDPRGRHRPAARHQSREGLLRRCAQHEPEDESERDGHGEEQHDLHQRRGDAVGRAVVGRAHAGAARRSRGLAGPPVEAGHAGRAPELTLHRPGPAVPVDRAELGGAAGRADLGLHLRLAPLQGDPARVRGLRLGARRLPRLGDEHGDDGGHHGPGRRGAPRSHGHAAVLRLQHGRLLRPLARHRPPRVEGPAHLPRELVPPRRRRQVPLAGLRRQRPRAEVDRRADPRRRARPGDADRLDPRRRRARHRGPGPLTRPGRRSAARGPR